MEFVEQLRNVLSKTIGKNRFELWFSEVAFDVAGNKVVVFASTSFQLDRLRKNFTDSLRSAAEEIGLGNCELSFRIADKSVKDVASASVDQAGTNSSKSEANASNEDSKRQHVDHVSSPRPQRIKAKSAQRRGRRFLTFSTFVDGECNHIARTSSQMVVKQPGDISPLFIHGPTGVGKTHLVEAVWCEARRQNKNNRILYLTAEQYTTYFLDALRGGSGLPAFRRKYRQADLLIIDDIQFFEGKQATLVEFAYTIDALGRENKQLILTADRPPAQLGKLGPEIVNRLCGGLVCSMKPVDAQTLVGISRIWAAQRKIELSDTMHHIIAGKMHGDARQLSGVLNRLRATSIASGAPITARMINEVLFELIPAPTRIIRLQDVRKTICEIFGIEESSLGASTRARNLAAPRMLAMWFARKHTPAGLHEISQFFGRRSHSSAISASATVDKWLQTAEKIEINGHQCDVRDLVSQIENGLMAG